MSSYIKLLWEWKWALLPSLFFNFWYLPISQAIKLPIWINKGHLHKIKGKIIIEGPVRPGMIKLGGFGGHMYPNNGIHITQWGGTIIFQGRCTIGNNSYICQGNQSTIIFGDNFLASSGFTILSYKKRNLGEMSYLDLVAELWTLICILYMI